MWLLEADGTLHASAPATLGLEVAAEAAPAAAPDAAVVTIRFAGTHDGRGFSAADRLRAAGYAGRLVAAGPLIPDQARHAFQCGFDAIAVEEAAAERHGLAAWRGAVAGAVGELYTGRVSSRGPERGIWALRHGL